MCIDSNNDKNIYYLLLTDRIMNSSGYMDKKTPTEQKNNFNLIASTLSKYYTNNGVIFGDVFLTVIDKDYYNLLLKIDQLNEKNQDTTVLVKQLEQMSKVYNSVKPFDFIQSYGNVHYLRIFTMPDKKIHIYRREIIDSYLNTPTAHSEFLEPKSNILKLSFESMFIYTKYTNSLPNSHSNIVDMINNEQSSANNSSDFNLYNNLYLANLSDDDINIIIKST